MIVEILGNHAIVKNYNMQDVSSQRSISTAIEFFKLHDCSKIAQPLATYIHTYMCALISFMLFSLFLEVGLCYFL